MYCGINIFRYPKRRMSNNKVGPEDVMLDCLIDWLDICLTSSEYNFSFIQDENMLTNNSGKMDRKNKYFQSHWKSKGFRYGGRKIWDFVAATTSLLFLTYTKKSRSCKERGTLQTCYSLWSVVRVSVLWPDHP